VGHDLDLSGSRDVIGHVTIQFTVGHFLFVSSDSFFKTHHIHNAYFTDDRQTTDGRTDTAL